MRDDDLNAARGFVDACVAGAALWLLVILACGIAR